MTFFLSQRAQMPDQAPALPQDVPSWLEHAAASHSARSIEGDKWFYSTRRRGAVLNEMIDELGGPSAIVAAAPDRWFTGLRDPQGALRVSEDDFLAWQRTEDVESLVFDMVADRVTFDPVGWGNRPRTVPQFEAEVNRRMRAELDEARSVMGMDERFWAELSGALVADMFDQTTIPLLFFGGSPAAVARYVATEAALNVAAETAMLPREFAQAERLGLDDPDVLERLAMAAAAGVVLSGAVAGVYRAATYRTARARIEADERPGNLDPVTAEQETALAERALREGRDPAEALRAEPATARAAPEAAEAGPAPDAGMPPAPVAEAVPAAAPRLTVRAMTGLEEVVSPAGTRVGVRWRVVEMDELQAATGELQPRDRAGRVASDEQVAEIAARLDPARLMPGVEADRGAPIIGGDMVIESGNGRVMALRRAADLHPDRYGAYVDAIRQQGFDVEGMRRPVLVGQRTTELDAAGRVAWVRENNQAAVARMAATEQGRADAAYLTQPVFDAWVPGRGLTAPENVEFLRRFLAQMPQSERAGLVTASGRLNAEGARRVRAALFARAFEADDLLALATEVDSPALRGLIGMLEDLAPDWASFRAMVEAGLLRGELDITPQLMEVVRLIARARTTSRHRGPAQAASGDAATQAQPGPVRGKRQSVPDYVREHLATPDMFGAGDADLSEAILAVFYRADDRARMPEQSGDILRRYLGRAQESGRADIQDIFGEAPPPRQLLREAIDLHEARAPRAGDDIDPDDAAMLAPEPDTRIVRTEEIAARAEEGAQGAPMRQLNDALEAELREAVAAPVPARALAAEPGADGLPQTILPGMEADAAQAIAARNAAARAELDARAAQSTIRRGGQTRVEDDAGGLFGGGQGDLLDAPAMRAGEPDELAAMRGDAELAASEIEIDGQTWRIGELLDELEADRAALDAVRVCGLPGGRGA